MISRNRQTETLHALLSRAAETRYGRNHHFDEIKSYRRFSKEVPVLFYRDMEEAVEQMKSGGRNLMWPGNIDNFALSAGTTGDGKHLPLSDDRLRSDRRFMRMIIRSYLGQRRNPLRLIGRHLSIPGTVERHGNIHIGEISGYSARRAPWWIRPFQLEDPRELTRLPFEEKFERVVRASMHANVRVITAVPSWILTLFQQVLRRSAQQTIGDVWPNLELLVCGGVKLAHYRPYLETLTGDLRPDFIETYGSSEGYFAFSDDLQREDLRLVCDNGIFYEFIPDPLPEPESLSIQPSLPLWEVETGVPYAVLVTTNSGLWRYAVNDIVEFTSTDPPRIVVKGRLSEMLDDFGEGLHLYEAEDVLNSAAARAGLEKGSFTVGAYLASENDVPRHYWFVQFFEPVHKDTLERIASMIDRALQERNRHYAIRRKSHALAHPEVHSITQTDINNWYSYRGDEMAQSKLPGSLPTRDDVEFFLSR